MVSNKKLKNVFSTCSLAVFLKIGIVIAGNITAAEYYIDTDPGEGSGNSLAASDGTFDSPLENVNIALNTSSLTIGVHTLYIRMKNDANTWGTPRKIPFNIDGNQYIAAQEYFIDSDPGVGNGTSLTAADGSFNQKREDGTVIIPTASFSPGLHNVYVRAQNAEGHWGTPRVYTIEIINQPTMKAMEYYVDTDPGAGHGTPMSSLSGSFNTIKDSGTAVLNTNSLGHGIHTIYVRGQNSFSGWGAVDSTKISVGASLVNLLTPTTDQTLTNSISFSWSYSSIADSFDLIADNNSDFSSPEISKKNIDTLKEFKQTSYSANFLGWLPEGLYYWKVIAYKGGVADSSDIQTFSFIMSKQPAPVWGPIFRAYKSADRDHFYCTSKQQQDKAIAQGYREEKPQGFVSVLPFDSSDMVPIYRLYNGSKYPGNASNPARCHFYTINVGEKDSCLAHNWLYEGIIGFARRNYHPGLVGLYHLYNGKPDSTIHDHLYTISEIERSQAQSLYGFVDKGVIAYVSPTGNNYPDPNSLNGPSVGSGADPFNGNLSHMETKSFSIPEGRMSLDFAHQYSSLSVLLKTPVRSLGYGWSHTYSACLTVNDGSIKVYWPGGGYNEYQLASCARLSKGIYDSLSKITDTIFEVKTKGQIVYRFSMLHKADSIAVLTSIKDRNNNRLQCAYDTSGNLITVTGPKGRKLIFAYFTGQDSAHLIKSVTDPANRSISFAYDTAGRLTTYINAKGDITHYGYDQRFPFEHLLDTVIQPEGNTIVNQYDSIASSNATHRLVSQKVGASGSPTQIIQLDYSTATFTKVFDSKNNEFDFYYGPQKQGIINRLLTPAGHATYQYADSLRNPGLPTTIMDGNGYITTASYDAWGNVLQINKPYDIHYNIRYTALNDDSLFIGPRNDSTLYNYDSKGNLIGIKTYRGLTRIAYLNDGLIDSVIDPLGNRSKLSYNSSGNVNRVLDPLDNISQFAYDTISRVISTINPKGQVSHISYSVLDQITSAIGSINDTTGYQYDRNGRLTTVQNAKHNNTVLGYIPLGMLDSIRNPLGKTIRFGYTGTLLTKKTFASGDTLGFSYDSASRITSFSGAANANFTYDLNDNVTSVTENSKQMAFGYDSLNRLAGYSYYSDYTSDSVSYGWDKAGNLQHVIYHDGGGTVNYSYYPDNLLYQVSDWLGDTTTYYYRNDGSLDYYVYPNGVKCTYSYDKAGRITGLANVKTNGDTINGYSFTLDAVGNIIGETRKEPYDAQQPMADNTIYTYNAGNQLLHAGADTFTYDLNGNMRSDSGIGSIIAYGFNPLNRLLTLDSNGVRKATYTYDVYGNRRAATRNGVTVNYVLDIAGSMANVLTERDAGGNPLYYYIYGLGMIYRIKKDNTVHCYHYDLRGSVIAMTDNSQTITHKYSYRPYGEMAAVSEPANDANPFRFVGKYGVMDEGNGISFMRARYYDAKIGRFLSEDPVWSVNLYGYAMDNSVSNIDPNGLDALLIGTNITADCYKSKSFETGVFVSYNKDEGFKMGEYSTKSYGRAIDCSVSMGKTISYCSTNNSNDLNGKDLSLGASGGPEFISGGFDFSINSKTPCRSANVSAGISASPLKGEIHANVSNTKTKEKSLGYMLINHVLPLLLKIVF